MPDTMPSIEVPAVAPTPYPFGLFSIAAQPTPADGHWEGGVWWSSQGCNQVGVTYNRCTVDATVPALSPNVTCGYAEGQPFNVYAFSERSVGSGGPGLPAKFQQARDNVLAGEQFAVEDVVWDLLSAAAGAADGTAANIAEGVAMAEQLLASVYGGVGVIHMSRFAASMLAFAGGGLRVQGSSLVTFLGTPVVAGGGYGTPPTTTDPDLTIYATGRVSYWRGELHDVGQTIDRNTNEVSALVQRTYVVGWDCTTVRVDVDGA